MAILDIVGQPAYTTRTLDLGDYVEDYRGATVEVWVTPSRAHLRAFAELVESIEALRKQAQASEVDAAALASGYEDYQERMLQWYAEMWRDVSLEEAREIREGLDEHCPGAWDWMCRRTSQMIREFREDHLKN